jgi:hypothetical protein
MSQLSDFAEKLLLDWMMTAGAATRPAAWFVALHTAVPGETGTGELGTASGYARRTVTFGAAVLGTGTTDNTADLTYGPATTSNWGVISGVSVWDATTGGNCLFVGTFATARTINVNDQLTIAAGALDLSLA